MVKGKSLGKGGKRSMRSSRSSAWSCLGVPVEQLAHDQCSLRQDSISVAAVAVLVSDWL